MKNIHLVLIIAILILTYLISMKWLDNNQNEIPQTIPEEPEITLSMNNLAPETTIASALTIPAETTSEIIPPAELTNIPTPPTTEAPTTKPENLQLIEYKNTNFGYHLSLPKQMYYAGFGARNGAIHTLAIQPDALPESFGDAVVRVSYYGKKILPELQNTTRYVDPNGTYILLLLDNAYSVRIESNNLNSPTVKAIESTVGVD